MKFEELVALVKKDALANGGDVRNGLLVEASDGQEYALVPPDSDIHDIERAYELFMMGRHFAQKTLKKRTLVSVHQVLPSWVADQDAINEHGLPVSRNPKRRDGLLVSTIDMQTLAQTASVYEVLNIGTPQIDLMQQEGDTAIEVHSPMLPAFLAGVRTAQQPMSEAIHAYKRIAYQWMQEIKSHREK